MENYRNHLRCSKILQVKQYQATQKKLLGLTKNPDTATCSIKCIRLIWTI